ncbi:MAG: FAD-binding oxidoreductase, partial [Terriglobia bacterium]
GFFCASVAIQLRPSEMPDESCWKQLAEIVGREHLSSDPARLLDGRWQGPPPKAIARPADARQAQEILRLANRERLTVAPAGNLTKQRLGGVPRQIDLLLSLERLHRITDYQPADLTVAVEAGVRMEDLAATLRRENQMLPLDAPFGGEATVGGVLSTNGSGPRRLAYGTARDVVLGAHFVTAEGTMAKTGGKVVKNVAGYDLAKLLIGSLGTLAVLTEVTFKVFPIPPASATLAFGFQSATEALRAAYRIVHSQFALQALDLLDRAAGSLLEEPLLSELPYTLMVRAAGPVAVVERTGRELPVLFRSENPAEIGRVTDEAEANLWEKIQELTPSFLRANPGGVVIKATVLLTRMEDVIAAASRVASEAGLAAATLARAGTGVVYCYLWPPHQSRDSNGAVKNERFVRAWESLFPEIERLGGRAIVEWAPASVKENVNLWGTLRDDFAVMQRLKAQFDPQGILNPGRFYGGI